MRPGLWMDADQVGAGVAKSVQIGIGRGDHQMHVERQARMRAQGFDHIRADGDVGHEMAVHHVNMHPVGPRRLDRPHLLAQFGKVGRQDGGGDDRRTCHGRSYPLARVRRKLGEGIWAAKFGGKRNWDRIGLARITPLAHGERQIESESARPGEYRDPDCKAPAYWLCVS